MSMEDLLKAFARHAASEVEAKPPALIVEALRDQAQFYTRNNPFLVGHLVTPRKGTDMKGAGNPYIVVAIDVNAKPNFSGDPTTNAYGRVNDVRVLSWHGGRYFAHWVESAVLEPCVEPAAASEPTYSEAATLDARAAA